MKTTTFIFLTLLLNYLAKAEYPHQVTITNLRTQGNGCLAGTVSANISPDGSAFSILLDNYQAESHGNMTLDRKSCETQIDFQVEPGWSYAVISADYRGFVHVENGSLATHQALYSFDGSRPINERPGFDNGNGKYAFRVQEFRGPILDNYLIHNEIAAAVAPWSPCNFTRQQTLFVTTFLTARTLTNLAQSMASINLDTIDGQVQSQNYQLVWRRCQSRTRPPRYR